MARDNNENASIYGMHLDEWNKQRQYKLSMGLSDIKTRFLGSDEWSIQRLCDIFEG